MIYNLKINIGKLYIFALILTPTFVIGSSLGLRLDDLLLFMYFMVAGMYKKNWNSRYLIFVISFSLIIFLSLFSGVIFNYDAGLSDLSKLFWLLKILAAFSIMTDLIKVDNSLLQDKIFFELIDFFVKCSFLSSIICIFQFFDLFSLNVLYIQYIAPTQFESLTSETYSKRSIGLLSNPHDQAFFLVLAFMGVLCLLRYRDNGFRNIYLIFLFFIFIGIITTISRTGILALTVCLIFYIYKFYRFSYFIFFTLLIYFLGYLGLSVLEDNIGSDLGVFLSILSSFSELININDSESFRVRADQSWIKNLDVFIKYPIFGVGFLPRDVTFGAPDGDYFYIARSLGIFGIIFILSYHIIVLYCVLNKNNQQSSAMFYILVVNLTCFIFMINSSVVTSPLLYPYVVFVSAYAFKRRLL